MMKKALLSVFAAFGLQCGLQAQFMVFNGIRQAGVTASGFDLVWTTNLSGSSAVKYGLTTGLEMGYAVSGGGATTQHQVTLSGLSAATFYYARPCVINGTDTTCAPTAYYSTGSTSSGQIRIFFNKSIDPSLAQNGASPDLANNGTAIENTLISYIDNAQNTIDVCVYNNNRTAIVNALKAAHNRGVRVRYIADFTANNTALSPAPAFSVAKVNPAALMHNKFMVVDAEDADRAVVWTGSMNWTNNNIFTDYNNVVVLHDQALARAYVREFEEMWGGTGATFNAGASKVGSVKTDNTPHRFYIGGKWVEMYFSPSDNTTNQIRRALLTANSNIEFLLYSFTHDLLGTTLKTKHDEGVAVYGAIANEGDQGCELPFLQSSGLTVIQDANLSGELHHKYAIVDAGFAHAQPLVVTGSHNWSAIAETGNDENTLIIYDLDIANMFLQEFGKRWCEMRGAGNCALSFPEPVAVLDVQAPELRLLLYPNPTQAEFFYDAGWESGQVGLELYDAAGRLLERQTAAPASGSLSLAAYAPGLYLLRIQSAQGTATARVVKY